MDVSGKDNYVLAMDVARPGQDLLVVTDSGYGKRTPVDEYRLTSRGAKGVKTITFTDAKGLLAAALVVREHEELVFISQNGMVQRTGVRGINRYGRAAQGVRVMNLREDDVVSAVALVVETDAATAAPAAGVDEPDGGVPTGALEADAPAVGGNGSAPEPMAEEAADLEPAEDDELEDAPDDGDEDDGDVDGVIAIDPDDE
jgi:DNA gyrase subunit A